MSTEWMSINDPLRKPNYKIDPLKYICKSLVIDLLKYHFEGLTIYFSPWSVSMFQGLFLLFLFY